MGGEKKEKKEREKEIKFLTELIRGTEKGNGVLQQESILWNLTTKK